MYDLLHFFCENETQTEEREAEFVNDSFANETVEGREKKEFFDFFQREFDSGKTKNIKETKST